MKMKVSIIIPVYNVEKFVLSCLESVANQTITDGLECIIVDDCGTDNSMMAVQLFLDRYHGNIPFYVSRHDINHGLSVARNTGIRKAKGEYLLFLDSDDELLPTAIEDFLSVLQQHPKVDLIQGSYLSEATGRYEGVILPQYTEERREIKSLMLDYDRLPIMAQNKFIRKDIIENHNLYFKEGIIHEDCYWTFFLAKYVSSLAFLHKKTYYYRFNPDSITGSPNIKKESYSFRIIIEDFSAHIDPFEQGAQKTLIWYLLLQMFRNDYCSSKEEQKKLLHCLVRNCRWFEQATMELWYLLPEGNELKSRLINFVIRLFKL